MMKNSYAKFAVAVVILIALAGTIGFLATSGVKLLGYEVRSVKGYTETLSTLVGTENKFETATTLQKEKIKDLEKAKKDFEKSKKEYEQISDETINIIKDVCKKEKYSLEFLWIRLGQYARRYNLAVKLIEPGGEVVVENNNNNNDNNANTNGEQTEEEMLTPPEKPIEAPKPGEIAEDIKNEVNDESSQNTSQTQASRKNYKIEAIGAYDKIADFVYAIETDDTLRFKLDNLVMEPSGENVRASFEIKNLEIIK